MFKKKPECLQSTGAVALPVLGTKTNYWPKNWNPGTIFKVFSGNRHFPVLAVDVVNFGWN